MATIGNDTNGRKRILFVAGDGSRKTIRVGKATTRQAEAFKLKVEALIGSTITGSVDDEVSRWLAGLPDSLHNRLAAVGLVKPRNASNAALGGFIDAFIAGRPDMKLHTLLNMRQVRRWLVDFFGESHDLRTITAADAEDWRAFMLKGKLGENTIRRHVGRARQLFKAAIRRGVTRGANPFEGMAVKVRADKTRLHFVKADDVRKIIDAAPDAQWKLLLALARWGGLRIPSEALALTWRDVDFEHGRFIVRASKTEHHADGGVRVVPMFPELAEHFAAVFAEAEEGAIHVITRYRSPASNLRTQLNRYILAAGLVPWAKPWQNMRATRATELADLYPSHVCAAWLGHAEAIADEFYRQVTDEHFRRASAAQIPAQSASELAGMDRKPEGTNCEKRTKNVDFALISQSCSYPQGESNPCMQTENLPS
jgi:integrase